MAKILVFDSGCGGLSILRQLRRRAPSASLVFACDNEAYPYGRKSAAFLRRRVPQVCDAFLEHSGAQLLVVACNSASTVVLPLLRKRYPIPVVGVVPAIKTAAARSATGSFALLATPATLKRAYTRELLRRYAAHCRVLPLGSMQLVAMAEEKLRGVPPDMERLGRILSPLEKQDSFPQVDTAVLGCTHFPLLVEELRRALPRVRWWLDPGAAVAAQVLRLLGDGAHQKASSALGGAILCTAPQPIPPPLAAALQCDRYHCLPVPGAAPKGAPFPLLDRPREAAASLDNRRHGG